MLPKKHRIRKNADFELICRYGKTISCDKLILKIKKNNLAVTRLGISVGLKFSSKAVARNRIRRQVRAFFEKNFKKIQISWDIIVIVQKGADNDVKMLAELENSLIKNGLINNALK
ncbi:MAG: ribonuclease P protein component [Candidatus Moraniibacteriota bacterium]